MKPAQRMALVFDAVPLITPISWSAFLALDAIWDSGLTPGEVAETMEILVDQGWVTESVAWLGVGHAQPIYSYCSTALGQRCRGILPRNPRNCQGGGTHG